MKAAIFLSLVSACSFLAMPACRADPLAEIAAFSTLKIEPAKLEKGEVISARTPGITTPRGQGVESAVIVAAPFEKTVEALKGWNGSKHSDLKVYLHNDLPAAPVAGDFKALANAPSNSAVKNFISATEKGEIQLAAGEAESSARTEKGGLPVAFWGGLLAKRGQAYAAGGLPSQPAYMVSGQKISSSEEANALLKSVPKIAAQFRSALSAVGLSGKPARAGFFWELVGAEGTAVVNLGASASTVLAGKTAQEADLQFYSSGSYFTFLTLQQAWPTTAGGRPATLVYRCDLISAAELGRLKGIERNAAGAALAKEMSRLIGYFQKDTAR